MADIYNNWIDNGNKFDDIVSNFQTILKVGEHNVHSDYEALYTSLISHQLDKLVEDLSSFHQIPIRHARGVERGEVHCSESRPDFLFLQPTMVFLLSQC